MLVQLLPAITYHVVCPTRYLAPCNHYVETLACRHRLAPREKVVHLLHGDHIAFHVASSALEVTAFYYIETFRIGP